MRSSKHLHEAAVQDIINMIAYSNFKSKNSHS